MFAGADKGLRIVAWLTLLYGSAHLCWYWGTPLGQSPVLDERENLQLAAQIASGTLPPEPFYRAMGYPLFLAGLRVTGLLSDTHPQAATAAGLLLHVLNTCLVATLARRWFGSTRAGVLAGLLHGANPVLIHFATQILDGVLANSFVLAGCLAIPAPGATDHRPRRAALLSLAWTTAALVRPQLLLLWLALPVVWLLGTGAPRRQGPALLAALVTGTALWLTQGLWNRQVGGEFRLLPWQGPYNLWAANHPGANGRYYTQGRLLAATSDPENPARRESVALYREATGDPGPIHPATLNAYWQDRLTRELPVRPGAWLSLQGRKLAYLAGDYEQYNNKTFSFHRDRSPWLRWNPLGWGLILLAAIPGLLALRRAAGPVLVIGAALAAGVLLAYASARFRLPLAALLCVPAGGALAAPRRWWPPATRPRLAMLALLGALGVLTYGNWFDGRDRSTYLQDHLLIALAAERLADDRIVWQEAGAALDLAPLHPDALRLALTARFNLLLRDQAMPADETLWQEIAQRFLSVSPRPDPAHLRLAALARWRAGDPAGPALWRSLGPDPEALAALLLSREATPDERAWFAHLPRTSEPGVFELMARITLNQQVTIGDPAVYAATPRLFPVRSFP